MIFNRFKTRLCCNVYFVLGKLENRYRGMHEYIEWKYFPPPPPPIKSVHPVTYLYRCSIKAVIGDGRWIKNGRLSKTSREIGNNRCDRRDVWTNTVGGEKTVLTGEKSVRAPADRRKPSAGHEERTRRAIPQSSTPCLSRCAGRQYPQRCLVGEDVRGARVRVSNRSHRFFVNEFFKIEFFPLSTSYEKSVPRVRPRRVPSSSRWRLWTHKPNGRFIVFPGHDRRS